MCKYYRYKMCRLVVPILIRLRKMSRIRLITACFTILFFIVLYQLHNKVVPYNERKYSPLQPILREHLGNFEPYRSAPKAHQVVRYTRNPSLALEYGMNVALSDVTSLDRDVPDTRMRECRHWDYPEDLPKTSVVVVFYNEPLSPVLRTVHSVVNRTPPQLLEEVILVDDGSQDIALKQNLDEYLSRFAGKVRVVRIAKREGLISARSKGARAALGEVLVFLDAHCEVNVNWLPPLLAPIYNHSRVITVPIVDGIDHDTFDYASVYGAGKHFRGLFEWGMLYKEGELPEREARGRAHRSMPYRSPTHAGGLFAVDRSYFLQLGAYDPGLRIWGGENFELSLKAWMCGGSVEWVPCSRVGHVYRGPRVGRPRAAGDDLDAHGNTAQANYRRVVETWFDARHKEFFYTRDPTTRYVSMGSIADQLALKRRLKCKPFQWFMDTVAYDVLDQFPEPPPNVAWGELRNVKTSLCVDVLNHDVPHAVGTSGCHGWGGNQLLRLNEKGQLGAGERCLEAAPGAAAKMVICKGGTVDGRWGWDNVTKVMRHRGEAETCLEIGDGVDRLVLMPCVGGREEQRWEWKEVEPQKVAGYIAEDPDVD